MRKYQDERHKRKRAKIIGGIFTTMAAAVLTAVLSIITVGNSKESENINQPETLQQEKNQRTREKSR